MQRRSEEERGRSRRRRGTPYPFGFEVTYLHTRRHVTAISHMVFWCPHAYASMPCAMFLLLCGFLNELLHTLSLKSGQAFEHLQQSATHYTKIHIGEPGANRLSKIILETIDVAY